jgi:hypothetical protein
MEGAAGSEHVLAEGGEVRLRLWGRQCRLRHHFVRSFTPPGPLSGGGGPCRCQLNGQRPTSRQQLRRMGLMRQELNREVRDWSGVS